MPITLGKIDKKSRLSTYDQPDGKRPGEHLSASVHAAPAKEPLGSDLTAARGQRGITLAQVAQDTHISLRHIQNLEEGRYKDLPGGMYNRAFLRTYCTYLGLDAEEFLARFERESAPLSERVAKVKARNTQIPTHTFRIPRILVWSVTLLASIVGLYFSRGWIKEVFSPYFLNPPAARMQPAQQQAPAPAETKPPEPAPSTATTTQPPPTTPPAEPAQVPAAVQTAAAQPAPGVIRLEFAATQICWISVASDGAHSQSRTLQPGDVQSYEALERFVVVLGNAGGVTLKIDGKPAKPLGKPGEVLKLQITPQNIPDLIEKIVG